MGEYVKQNFESGQILKAEHLNHIEDGITTNSNLIPTFSKSDGTKKLAVKKDGSALEWVDENIGIIVNGSQLMCSHTFDQFVELYSKNSGNLKIIFMNNPMIDATTTKNILRKHIILERIFSLTMGAIQYFRIGFMTDNGSVEFYRLNPDNTVTLE